MTVKSGDPGDNERQFSLRVHHQKLAIEEFITISDPWTFEQRISMNDSNKYNPLADEDIEEVLANAAGNHSVKTKIQFTGAFWRQEILWDNDDDGDDQHN